MRFNLAHIPPEFIDEAVNMLPFIMVVMGATYWAFGLYRGVWRFASLTDLVRIGQAVATGTTLLLFLLFVFNRMAFVPRSLPLFFGIFQVLLLAGPRLFYRWRNGVRFEIAGHPRSHGASGLSRPLCGERSNFGVFRPSNWLRRMRRHVIRPVILRFQPTNT